MYLNHLYTLNVGDIVTYTDLNGKKRRLEYIKDTGLTNCIIGRTHSLQQQFTDEVGSIVHVPIDAWNFTRIMPCVVRKSDVGL